MAVSIFDIDGVFNAFYGPAFTPGQEGATDAHAVLSEYEHVSLEHAGGRRARVFMNVTVVQEGLKLLEPLTTFTFGTAWTESDAHDLLKKLGRNETWPHLKMVYEDVGMGTWKYKSIVPFIESLPLDEPVVWVEDELESDAFEFAERRGNMLAIKPDPVFGLTADQFVEIADFLKAHQR